DGIAAKEVDLNLHRIAQPSEDVDVIPAFFRIAARRIVIDPDGVIQILIKLRIELGLKNLFQRAELGFFLGLERSWIFQYLAIAISQNIRRKPTGNTQHTRLEARRDQGLHERLAG